MKENKTELISSPEDERNADAGDVRAIMPARDEVREYVVEQRVEEDRAHQQGQDAPSKLLKVFHGDAIYTIMALGQVLLTDAHVVAFLSFLVF